MPKISAGGASGGGQLAVPDDAFVREDGVITAPPAGGIGALQAANNLSDVSSQQTALNNLAGAVTSAEFLRGTGTNVTMSAIQAADLPAATSGAQGAVQLAGDLGNTAAAPEVLSTHLSAPLPLAQGGTGLSESTAAALAAALGALLAANNLSDLAARQTALNNLAGAVTSASFLRGNGTNVSMSAIQAADLPTGTTSAKGALQLDGTAGDIQPAQQSAAAGSNGKPADSGHAHPPGSSFLCTPSQYAPASLATLTVSTTSLAAFSSANVNTGSFTAPASGSVIVTASFYSITGNTADEMGVALASHGTTTVVGNAAVMQFSSAGFCAPATIPFLVTGLTPGTSYNFDLMGNATSGGSWSVLAVGTQAPVLTSGGRGGPVVMTVQAV